LIKLFSEIRWKGSDENNAIYLSFDDGPNPDSTSIILDILKENQVKASFFCLGKNVEKYPDLFKRILDEKHMVGNHGYEHLSGWISQNKAYLDDVEKADERIRSRLFRPAFGRIKYSQYRSLRKKYQIVMWSMMPGDFDKRIEAKKLSDYIIKNTKPGEIITLHDNEGSIASIKAILGELILALKAQNFTFQTLD